MRVHRAVFARGLRRYSTYRAATLAHVLTSSVFGVINAMVLLALFDARPEINGYDARDAVTQVFVAQALLGVAAVMGPPLDLEERIRDGAVATDLLRPVPLQSWWLADDLGRAAFQLVFRSVPTFVVGALLFDLRLPDDPVRWGAVLTSFTLAAVVAFGLRYLYALAGFWLTDTRGVWAVAGLLVLDEPTIGLDVVSKTAVREFLLRLNAREGTTILLTTHDLGDVERLCRRVVVIDRGTLAYDGDLAGLRASVPAPRVLVVDLAAPAPPVEVPGGTCVRVEGPRQWLELSDNPAPVIAEIARRHAVADLTLREPDIEHVVAALYRGATPSAH